MQLKNYLQKLKILWNPLLFFQIIWTNRFLLRSLVVRNIASRYRGSFLGLIWSFVHPLMMLCVYTFVFSVVFKARWGIDTGGGRGAFAIIMFCGMAMFNIFSESVSNSCGVVVDNPNFVKKVIFPLEILPLAQVAASLILGMAWFPILPSIVNTTLFLFSVKSVSPCCCCLLCCCRWRFSVWGSPILSRHSGFISGTPSI